MQIWLVTLNILLLIGGNLLLRAGMMRAQSPTSPQREQLALLGAALRSWRVAAGVAIIFLSVVAWICGVVLWHMEWSYSALGLSYVAAVVFSWWYLSETLTLEKMFGAIIIVIGALLIVRYSGF
jgi:drug/metabolite transporter (DMT)-like permease